MITRNGKIARLPRPIREELNQRLECGEPGNRLVQWLNEMPEVKAVLAQDFAGRGISKQNLSEWRNGGFAEWWVRQEYRGNSDELAADAKEIAAGTGGRLGDHLATVLEARYASVLTGWNGEYSSVLAQKLKLMHELCRDVAMLRRGDHQAAKLQLVRDNQELLRKRTDEEVLEHFQKWMENEKIRDWLCAHWPSPEERKRQLYAMYGMTPPEEKTAKPWETSNSKNQTSENVQASTAAQGAMVDRPTADVSHAGAGVGEGDIRAMIAELNRQAAEDEQRANSPMKSRAVKPGQTVPGGETAKPGETSKFKNQTSEKVQTPSSSEGSSTSPQGGVEGGTPGQGTRPTGGETNDNSPMKSGSVKPGQTVPDGETSSSKVQNPENIQAPIPPPFEDAVSRLRRLALRAGYVPPPRLPDPYANFRSSS